MKLAALALLAAALAVPAKVDAGYQTPIKLGAKGPAVVELEYRLKSYGYTVTVDTVFDKRTDRAVRHFQRANRLEVDGVVGPITLAALVTATRPAVRVNPPAPQFADDCAEARYYRVAAGLPEVFDALIRRESNCTNTPISRTGCCVGALQLHQIIFRDHRMLDRLAACGATWANVRGDDVGSWQRQMCAAKALYDVMGMAPWRLG